MIATIRHTQHAIIIVIIIIIHKFQQLQQHILMYVYVWRSENGEEKLDSKSDEQSHLVSPSLFNRTDNDIRRSETTEKIAFSYKIGSNDSEMIGFNLYMH